MDNTLSVHLPITQVTLMEDRARITRRGPVELVAKRTTLHIPHVSPVLVDRTVVAAAQGFEVGTPRIARRTEWLDTNKPEAETQLASDLRQNTETQMLLRLQLDTHKQEAATLNSMRLRQLQEFSEDCSWENPTTANLHAALQEIDTAAQHVRHVHAQLEQDIQELGEERRRLQAQQVHMKTTEALHTAELSVDIVRELDTNETCIVEVSYIVPNACWRPFHKAEVHHQTQEAFSPTELLFTSYASVWQNTGEDWNDIDLELSTERASLGETAPELETDWLHLQPTRTQVDVEYREVTVDALSATDPELPAQDTQDTQVTMPGIGQDGVPLTLPVSHKVSIAQNGRPHNVKLGSFTMPTQATPRAMPELVPEPLLVTHQRNRADAPILQGPVHLVRNGGDSGRSELEFIPPGGVFDLGWGPMPDMRVGRQLQSSTMPPKLLSGWRGKKHHVKITLTNLSHDVQELELQERIPVSEIDKIEVEIQGTAHGIAPDADGFLRWPLAIEPLGVHTISYTYIIRQHPSTFS